ATHVQEAALGLAREDPDVALHREREADPDGVPVHGGDDGLADRERRRLDPRRTELGLVALLEGRPARFEIGTDAERLARAGHDDGAHVVVRIAVAIRLPELA